MTVTPSSPRKKPASRVPAKRLRKAESPFLADWFAILCRWLVLTGVVIALAVAGVLDLPQGIILLLAILDNVLVSILAVLNIRLPFHRLLNVALDLFFAILLFAFSGGMTGPLPWVGLLPLCTAAIYFEWRGTLSTVLVLILFQVGWTLLTAPSAISPLIILVVALSYLMVAGLLAFLGRQLMLGLRNIYQNKGQNHRRVDPATRQKEQEGLKTLYQLVEALSSTLDYQVVLDTALELAASAVGEGNAGTTQLVRAFLLFGEHDLQVGSARGLTPRDLRASFPAEKGVLHDVLQSGNPLVLEDPARDAELRYLAVLQACKSACCLPLLRGLNAYGVLLLAHPQPGFFNPERLEVLEVISHQVVIAIQNARLYHDLALEKERIIETQDEARKKLARDLHDGPTQSVAALAMRINILRHLVQTNPGEALKELDRIESLAKRTTQEVRHMLFTLRPLVLESEGLDAALKTMAAKMKDLYEQNVQVETDPEVIKLLDMGRQTVVFYLCEEAVNNARKHAQAKAIRVFLKFAPGDAEVALLEVADNGKGFDVSAVASNYGQRGSLGMVNLQERSDLVNGVLSIDSEPGKGTRVRVHIPLTEQATDRLQHPQ